MSEIIGLKPGDVFIPYKLFVGIFIPNGIVSYPGISPSAKILYGILTRYAGENGDCFPSNQKLAEELTLTERHVRRILFELKLHGFIEINGSEKKYSIAFLWHEVFSNSLRKGADRNVQRSDIKVRRSDKNVQRSDIKVRRSDKNVRAIYGVEVGSLKDSEKEKEVRFSKLLEYYPQLQDDVLKARSLRIFKNLSPNDQIYALEDAAGCNANPSLQAFGVEMFLDMERYLKDRGLWQEEPSPVAACSA